MSESVFPLVGYSIVVLGDGDVPALGVQQGGELVAALDLIRDAPGPGAWWVGNLMVDPAQRRRGLGERTYQACERWMISQGARSVDLCVQEQNPGALRFWSRMGFAEVERVPHRLKALESVVAVMHRVLPHDG